MLLKNCLCLFEHRVSQVEPCANVLDFLFDQQEDGFAFFVPENKWSSAFHAHVSRADVKKIPHGANTLVKVLSSTDKT